MNINLFSYFRETLKSISDFTYSLPVALISLGLIAVGAGNTLTATGLLFLDGYPIDSTYLKMMATIVPIWMGIVGIGWAGIAQLYKEFIVKNGPHQLESVDERFYHRFVAPKQGLSQTLLSWMLWVKKPEGQASAEHQASPRMPLSNSLTRTLFDKVNQFVNHVEKGLGRVFEMYLGTQLLNLLTTTTVLSNPALTVACALASLGVFSLAAFNTARVVKSFFVAEPDDLVKLDSLVQEARSENIPSSTIGFFCDYLCVRRPAQSQTPEAASLPSKPASP